MIIQGSLAFYFLNVLESIYLTLNSSIRRLATKEVMWGLRNNISVDPKHMHNYIPCSTRFHSSTIHQYNIFSYAKLAIADNDR